MFLSVRHLLATLFDWLAEHSKQEWFEKGVVMAATGGFLMHLLLIASLSESSESSISFCRFRVGCPAGLGGIPNCNLNAHSLVFCFSEPRTQIN